MLRQVSEVTDQLSGAAKFLSPERLDGYMSTGVAMGTKVLIALVIFIIGSWIAKKVKNGITKLAKKSPQLDETLFNFLGSIARWVIMAFVFIAILGQFGVETTSIVALLGAAGLAVGLAPNGKIWGEKIINHSHHPVRGVEMKFNVAYDDDIEKARQVILKTLAAHPHIKSDPAPFVEVETLTERSAELVVRPFTDGQH